MNDNNVTQTASPKTKETKLTKLAIREQELEQKLKDIRESKRKLEAAKKEREASQNKKDRTRFLVLIGLYTVKLLHQAGNNTLLTAITDYYEQEIQKTIEMPQPPNKMPEEHKKYIDRKIATLTNEKKLIERQMQQVIAGTFK